MDAYTGQRLVSVSRTVSGFAAENLRALVPDAWQVRWRDPVARQAFAGWGSAAVLRGDPADRFVDIRRQADALFRNAVCEGPGEGPRLAGGFSFSKGYLSDKVWQSFAPGCFVLPHFQHETVADREWLTVNVLADIGMDEREAVGHCREVLDDLVRQPDNPTRSIVPNCEDGDQAHAAKDPVTKAEWHGMVSEVLDRIASGRIGKVALARMRELNFPQPPDTNRAWEDLGSRYNGCYRFLFQQEDGSVFLGASPELLCALDDTRLQTMALAGTAPRGQSAAEDGNACRELLASSKNRNEHNIVIDNLIARLQEFDARPNRNLHTEILSLHNVHHLHTPVVAEVRRQRHILEWLEHLHPTAALGGDPVERAMALIDELETQPRGWYAAPFGLFDRFGHGAFCVGIRSAVIHKTRAWLFAGAGIVAGSQPELEWDETEWKFQPMHRALTFRS